MNDSRIFGLLPKKKQSLSWDIEYLHPFEERCQERVLYHKNKEKIGKKEDNLNDIFRK